MTTSTNAAGTCKLYGSRCDSVVVVLNSHGHLDNCDDMEQVKSVPDARAPHKGDKASFFTRGFGGALFANERFFSSARKIR